MRIIVVGCGKVGQKIIEKLNLEGDHDITVIDTKRELIEDVVGQYDIMGVSGNGANVSNLNEAGIKDADILLAVTGSDEINLLTCLLAKKLGDVKTIARVRNPEYSKELHYFKEDLGLEMIIIPEHTAAMEIARVLRFPTAIGIDTFAKGRVEILKFEIPRFSVLDNLKICELNQRLDSDVLVCGVERGENAVIPDGNFVLHSGDLISVVTSMKHTTDFFLKIGVNTNKVKSAMIVGGGRTGYYLAKRLIRSNIQVKIIDIDPSRCETLAELLPKASIVCGDATDNNLLIEEGIEKTESFISMLDIDEENILLSLFAKSKSDCKIVTKINRIAYDSVISGLNLGTTICPKEITAEYIVRFVRAMKNSMGSNVENMHYILDGKAEALEFNIKSASPVINTPIEKLKLKQGILIACINRGGEIIIPRGADEILLGDTVVVVTTESGYDSIEDILE